MPDVKAPKHKRKLMYIFTYFLPFYQHHSSRTGVGIATGYGLNGPGSNPGLGKIICLFHSLHTGYRAHRASCAVDAGYDFPVGKAAGA
jgi:hypothetical protein